jgi:protein tyrosine/serine phosphatase
MRDLYWSGGYNSRDLGGLPAADGGRTVPRRIVRTATLDRLTEAGWASLVEYGVRTIVDLRDDGEVKTPKVPRPDAVRVVRVPVETIAGRQWYESVRHPEGTPRIFARYLADRPEAVAGVVKAVAAAGAGGVIVHCAGGRDRTGPASLVLLALAGVEPSAVADDYVLSYEQQRAAYAAMGMTGMLEDLDYIDRVLAEAGLTAHRAALDVLEGCDIAKTLSAAGVTAAELDAVRGRLLGEG